INDLISLFLFSVLSKAPNLLRGGNKSIVMACNAGAASANSTGEGDLRLLRDGPADGEGEGQDLLQDGPERAGDGGGGENNDNGDNGDGTGNGDGGAAAHSTIAARVVSDKRGCGRTVFLGPCTFTRALYGAMGEDKAGGD
nr:hypothetical protein [Tanacetum cinerariifolium]